MAIIKSLPGVEVTIFCNGIQVVEHPNDEDDVRPRWKRKTTSKYIESVSDTEFFIQLRVGPAYKFDSDCLNFSVILDGDEVANDGYICHPTDFIDGRWEEEADGTEISTEYGRMLMKYKFANLLTTDDCDDDMSQEEKEEMGLIGLIEVRVHQAHKGKSTIPKAREFKRSWESIPEKVLKGQAISHCTAYSDETKVSSPSNFQTANLVKGWDAPAGVFRFKYRSREDLRKNYIIKRSPSPERRDPRSRSFDSFTAEEKRQWAKLKFDEMHLLSTLDSKPDIKQSMFTRIFDDLNKNEVNLLAQQKHEEITGVKIEPGPTIKQEPGRGHGSNTSVNRPNARQYTQIAMGNGKMAFDLTEEDSGDDGDNDDDLTEIFTAATSASSAASPNTDIEEIAEGKQSAAANTQAMVTLTPDPRTSVVPQDIAAMDGVVQSVDIASTATALTIETPRIKTQPVLQNKVPGGYPVGTDVETCDVPEAKRRKIVDIDHSLVEMEQPFLLPSVTA